MKNIIKILVLICFAHCLPALTMEQAEETSIESMEIVESTSQLTDAAENLFDILPNELIVKVLEDVYFDKSICTAKDIYEAFELIKQKLPNIANVRLVRGLILSIQISYDIFTDRY